MADFDNTLELAQRLRRDALATTMPHYASLMRQAADELEGFWQLEQSAPEARQRQAG